MIERRDSPLMTSLSSQVFTMLDYLVPALAHHGRPLGYDPKDPGTIRAWLKNLWHLVRSSVPLMRAALKQLSTSYVNDPDTLALLAYFEKHIDEELEHDEWLLNDLELLGCSPGRLSTELPPASVAALAGSQYYYIYHHHPVVLLGYIALCEGYAPKVGWIEEMRVECDAPIGVWRTMARHSVDDVAHREELSKLLDALSPTPAWRRYAVIANAIRSVSGWRHVLEEAQRPVRHCEKWNQ